MPQPTDRPADGGLASTLRMSTMRLARRLRAERADDDALTLTQLAALATLDRHGPLTLTALAAHEHVRPPSMTRVCTALEGLGLVQRSPHPSDGRQVVVQVTGAGADLLARDRQRRDAWLSRQLQDLDAGDLDALRRAVPVLERLARG
ncbi:MAG TPA: MarR family transcriptional regulator [Jiangellales bacterium]|nr:MarR family transcriptional regulator [Jiangellales bacterium]